MVTKDKEIEIEIGSILYSFKCRFYYEHGIHSQDPTEGSDTVLKYWEILDLIHASNQETGNEHFVTDPSEYDMVTDWVDFQSEFDRI